MRLTAGPRTAGSPRRRTDTCAPSSPTATTPGPRLRARARSAGAAECRWLTTWPGTRALRLVRRRQGPAQHLERAVNTLVVDVQVRHQPHPVRRDGGDEHPVGPALRGQRRRVLAGDGEVEGDDVGLDRGGVDEAGYDVGQRVGQPPRV